MIDYEVEARAWLQARDSDYRVSDVTSLAAKFREIAERAGQGGYRREAAARWLIDQGYGDEYVNLRDTMFDELAPEPAKCTFCDDYPDGVCPIHGVRPPEPAKTDLRARIVAALANDRPQGGRLESDARELLPLVLVELDRRATLAELLREEQRAYAATFAQEFARKEIDRLKEQLAAMTAARDALKSELARSGNYTCDFAMSPGKVTFANGRTVEIHVADDGGTFLEIGWRPTSGGKETP
jgi:hypothetical protein